MATLETLRAHLKADSNLRSTLLASAAAADEVAAKLKTISRTAEVASSSLSSLEGEGSAVSRTFTRAATTAAAVRSQIESVGDEAASTAAKVLTADGRVDALGEEGTAAGVKMRFLASGIDSVGDNAVSTAAQTAALDSAIDNTADASTSLSAGLGPLRGRLSTLGPAAAGLVPILGGLASSLGGVAVASGATAGALGGIFAGGLLGKAERLAAANADLANRGEALEQIFGDFKDRLVGALEPLQSIANARLVTDAFEGIVDLAGQFATSIAGIAPLVRDLGRSLGGTALATAPEIFGELSATVETLGPAIEDIFSSGIRAIPTTLAFFRSEAQQLLPELRSLGGSLISTTAAVADFGSNLLGLVLPALTPIIDLIGGVADAAARLPQPLLLASAAAAVATVAVGTYGGVASAAAAATGVLAGAIGVVTAPISALSVAIGAVVGVLALGAAKLGLFSAALNATKAVFGAIVSGVEFAINTFLDLYDALGVLRFVLFPGIAAVELLIASFKRLKPVFSAVGGVIVGIGETIQSILAGIANTVGAVIDAIDQATNALGLDSGSTINSEVDFSAANPTVDASGGGTSPSDIQPPTPSQPTASSGGTSSRSRGSSPSGGRSGGIKIDMRNSEFGTDRTRTKEAIYEAVEQANREARNAEEGRVE